MRPEWRSIDDLDRSIDQSIGSRSQSVRSSIRPYRCITRLLCASMLRRVSACIFSRVVLSACAQWLNTCVLLSTTWPFLPLRWGVGYSQPLPTKECTKYPRHVFINFSGVQRSPRLDEVDVQDDVKVVFFFFHYVVRSG